MFIFVRMLVVAIVVSAPGCRPRAQQSASLAGAGLDKLKVCSGDRAFTGNPTTAFDYRAPDMSLKNAYWLAAFSANIYSKKDVILGEMKRLGFHDGGVSSTQQLAFLDQDSALQRNFRSRTSYPYADTQALWAENNDGAILAFRGTEQSEIADIISDLWFQQRNLMTTEEEEIGTMTPDGGSTAAEVMQTPSDVTIRVHKGFWYALDIVWKDIEARAKRLLSEEEPKERKAKMAVLDKLVDTMNRTPELLGQQLAKMDDWRVPLEGKKNFVKQWKVYQNNPSERSRFYDFINTRWTSWQKPVWITGHSMGGALGSLAAWRLLKMGVNVKGLYTFGSPRAGNHAFVHDLRVRAYDRGMKIPKGEGNLVRFVHHMDIIARVPPVVGWSTVLDDTSMNPFLDKWDHVSKMRYLTGGDASKVELWLQGDAKFDEKFAEAKVPLYAATMPVEAWKGWIGDHNSAVYAEKIEMLQFGRHIACQ